MFEAFMAHFTLLTVKQPQLNFYHDYYSNIVQGRLI